MNELNFEKLDLNNQKDVLEVATIHSGAPREWTSDHSFSDDCVIRAIERMRTSEHGCLVVLARNEHNAIVGFHWIQLEVRASATYGNVVSLWVHPGYRQQGVASYLKELGESWLRCKGASEIRTQVYVDNQKMVALNEKLGYKVVLVGMSKDLK